MARYKERSVVIGHNVVVMSDSPGKKPRQVARGTVVDIGENLELVLKDHPEPITSGRLILI
jgi:hypothetical protein